MKVLQDFFVKVAKLASGSLAVDGCKDAVEVGRSFYDIAEMHAFRVGRRIVRKRMFAKWITRRELQSFHWKFQNDQSASRQPCDSVAAGYWESLPFHDNDGPPDTPLLFGILLCILTLVAIVILNATMYAKKKAHSRHSPQRHVRCSSVAAGVLERRHQKP